MRKWFRGNKPACKKLDRLIKDIYNEFGWKTKLLSPLIGRYIFTKIREEEDRLAKGWTYKPATVYEKNRAASDLKKTDMKSANEQAPESKWVPPRHA